MYSKVTKFSDEGIAVSVYGTKHELKDSSKAALLAIRRAVKMGGDPSPRHVGKPKQVPQDFKGQVTVQEQVFYFNKQKPDADAQSWLCKMDDGIEPEVLGGPFQGSSIPDKQMVRLVKAHRCGEADVYFQATLRNGSLELHPFSGGYMDEVREKAGV